MYCLTVETSVHATVLSPRLALISCLLNPVPHRLICDLTDLGWKQEIGMSVHFVQASELPPLIFWPWSSLHAFFIPFFS